MAKRKRRRSKEEWAAIFAKGTSDPKSVQSPHQNYENSNRTAYITKKPTIIAGRIMSQDPVKFKNDQIRKLERIEDFKKKAGD